MINLRAVSLQIVLFIIMLLEATNLGKDCMSRQNNIIIYTKGYCPYCVKAKHLLAIKNLNYEEIDVENDETLLQEMLAKSNGRKTVPQIFINNYHVGGCDDLYALDESGELDKLLKE